MTGGDTLLLARPVCLLPLLLPALGIVWCLLATRLPAIRRHGAGTLAILFPLLAFVGITVWAVNVPGMDDFDAVLGYMNHPLGERIRLLFSQHNEHRVVTTRLVSELVRIVLGNLDFKEMRIATSPVLH
jgi:hypothetical protein